MNIACTNCGSSATLHCVACRMPYCSKACYLMHTPAECSADGERAPEDSVPVMGHYTIEAARMATPETPADPASSKNQDTYLTEYRGGVALMAVFDGHGTHGALASATARDVFKRAFHSSVDVQGRAWKKWLRQTTAVAQLALLTLPELIAEESGTTATVAVLDRGFLYSGSVGDSGLLALMSYKQDEHTLLDVEYKQYRSRVPGGGDVTYPVRQGMYKTSQTDSLGHVMGRVDPNNVRRGYFRGKMKLNRKIRVSKDSVIVVASDGFLDIFDGLSTARKRTASGWRETDSDAALRFAFSANPTTFAKNLAITAAKVWAGLKESDDVTVCVLEMG